MPWQNLNSTNLAAFDYDAENQLLSVQFSDGAEWRYHGVPQHVVDAFPNAESARKFLDAYIKPYHHAEKVR
jgi:hypothetical protein